MNIVIGLKYFFCINLDPSYVRLRIFCTSSLFITFLYLFLLIYSFVRYDNVRFIMDLYQGGIFSYETKRRREKVILYPLDLVSNETFVSVLISSVCLPFGHEWRR